MNQLDRSSKGNNIIPIFIFCWLGFHVFLLWPRIYQTSGLFYGWISASIMLTSWFGYLFLTTAKENRDWFGFWKPKKPHLVQMVAQSSVFMGLAWFWPVAWAHLPLLLAQLFFAYMIDILLAISKKRKFRIGFGAIPITISTNLFLFFKDDYFYLQWVLIFFGLASRELFRWKRNGEEVHIFNPSAITLSVMGMILILTQNVHLSWGESIASNHGINPYGYELIFCAGLLVQTFFSVGLMTMSAALTSWFLSALYFKTTGNYHYVDTIIPIAVFLGMNLLFTDPASTPRNHRGKIIYGIMYGTAVFVLYDFLRGLNIPATSQNPGLNASFFDKLLFVPIMNLSVRWIEEKAEKLPALPVIPMPWCRMIYLCTWTLVFFVWVRPLLKDHPGKDVVFWEDACSKQSDLKLKQRACENRNILYKNYCESNVYEACHDLGLSFEKGEGSAKDLLKAAALYEKACQGGLLDSCIDLGSLLYDEGEREQKKELIDKSSDIWRYACDRNQGEACLRLATYLISNWHQSIAWEQAYQYLNKACDLNQPWACFELSKQHLRSYAQNQSQCEQGDGFACLQINQMFNKKEKAKKELEIACQGDIPIACANLGIMYWRGDGVSQNEKLALQFLDQACLLKMSNACQQARDIKEHKVKPPIPHQIQMQQMLQQLQPSLQPQTP